MMKRLLTLMALLSLALLISGCQTFVNKGNSGGPVFDMRGNVVGITVGKLDLKKISDDQGFLPEDVNFAIHVDRLPKMVGMTAATEESKAELSAEELYQAMVGKVVMVATYK